MKKSPIKILGIIAALLLTLLISLIALPFLVDVNAYKPQITQAIKKQSNIDVELNGDIQLSLFPWVGIALHDIIIHDSPLFGNNPLLQAKTIEVRAKLWPLLQKHLEMKTITLDGVAIKLATLPDGRNNWALLLPSDADTDSSHQANAGTEAPPLSTLTLGGLSINDASLNWKDASTHTELQIQHLNLNTGIIALGQPISIQGSASIHNLDTLPTMTPDTDRSFKATLALEAGLTLEKNIEKIRLNDLILTSTVHSAALPVPLSSVLNISADIDLKTQQLHSKVDIQIDGMRLHLTATGKHILDAAQLSGNLQIDTFSPRSFIEKYAGALDMADTSTLKTAAFSSQFSANEKQIKLNKLHLAFDQTTLIGQSTVNLSPLSYDIIIHGTAIDIDRYLPPTPDVASAPSSSPPAAVDKDTPLLPNDTLVALRELALNMDFTMQSVKASGIELTHISLRSTAKDGLIKIDPLTATLSDGTLHSQVSINLQNSIAKFHLTQKAQNIAAGPLLQAFADTSLLTGQANFKANLQAQGNNEKDLMESLSGTSDFSFTEGAINGINFADTIRRAKAKLKGHPLPKNTAPQKTDFTELMGNIRIDGLQINNPSLSMKSPYLRITGRGDVNLNTESIDYLANIKITGTPKGQGGKELQELMGITIPLRIGGTFDKLTYKPDFKRVIKDKTNKKVKQRLDKVLKKKLGVNLKDLKSLF